MTVFSQIRAVSLREQVAEQIRTAIIEGRLRPNDHIVEAALTEQLGVSRTPVREALILLEREALVVSQPNRGCYVRAFNIDDVRAIFSMRVMLENFAAELIIDQLNVDDYYRLNQLIDQQQFHIQQADFKQVRSTDMAFHQYLINRGEHPLLMRNWQEIVAQVAAVLYVRADGYPNYDELQAIQDHRRILEAYQDHDLERLRAENRRINQRVQDECIQALEAIAVRGGKPKR
ncbi:MAG: GntR family transcriptional regulator [Anaerolinea sp.]|nr:GntR family transcriptional regulator [Anaerolinea sp.]